MEIEETYLAFVQYLKKKMRNEPISEQEVADFALDIAKEIDRRKVYGEPCLVLERLYEEVLWLKSEVSKEIQHTICS